MNHLSVLSVQTTNMSQCTIQMEMLYGFCSFGPKFGVNSSPNGRVRLPACPLPRQSNKSNSLHYFSLESLSPKKTPCCMCALLVRNF
jgi:hypothetical protein